MHLKAAQWNFITNGLFLVVSHYVKDAIASLPNTYPHTYPGQPRGDFSPQWQSYFEVKDKLTNLTFNPGRSFAGNLPVQRPGHPNNTLFFWGFEKSLGSLTDNDREKDDVPWAIWLNGGPGASSMFGLFYENGPILLQQNGTTSPNKYSWNKAADYFWLDQPVGVGFSTADSQGYATDEIQVTADFIGFLGNLVKVFPSLAKRPLYLTGESYAGTYIPYIMKGYFEHQNPPVRIAGIAIGDGALGELQVFMELPTLSVLQTFPQLIAYDSEVYNYYKAQSHLCKYDVNLTYPQNGPLKPIQLVPFSRPESMNLGVTADNLLDLLEARYQSSKSTKREVERRQRSREEWKRDLADRVNGTIDPWYGCHLLESLLDYAYNFTYPWTIHLDPAESNLDTYNIPSALFPPMRMDPRAFMNDPINRAALHAPTSKDFRQNFGNTFTTGNADPSPPITSFLTDLATNMTTHNVRVVLFSGNNDGLVPHRGTEVVIQNTTFGGIQGFTCKPSTPWYDDAGTFAGVIHQEREWTYALFADAPHYVPATQPKAAFTFLREFILGKNKTGYVDPHTGKVVGGEDKKLAGDILPGDENIYLGEGATLSTFIYPEATRAAWKAFTQG